MQLPVFLRFFIYTFSFIIIAIFLAIIFEIKEGRLNLLEDIPMMAVLVFFAISFSLAGSIWARKISVEVPKESNANIMVEIIASLSAKDKFNVRKFEDKTIIFPNSKYYEWFYGKIVIKENKDNFIITGANCVIQKYFSLVLDKIVKK